MDVCAVQRATANELTAKALAVCLTSRGTHHAFQGIVEDNATNSVVRHGFATKAFLFETTNLAVSFATEARRKIKIGAAKSTAAHIHPDSMIFLT